MVRKKIDNRLRVLIENGVTLGHRTMFVVVGDKGRDQVRKTLVLGFGIQFREGMYLNCYLNYFR